MRRCYRGVALALGGILMTGHTSFNSCNLGTMIVYAAEDALIEELETAFQEKVLIGEENVETEILEEKDTEQPDEEPEHEETIAEEPESGQVSGSGFSLEEQEYQVLLRIVEAEAGGEDTTGKMLVANVVMNRVRNGHFPDTVSGVVYQKSGGKAQFSPTVDGRMDRVSVSQETVDAVSRVMNGEDVSAGALYFKSIYSDSSWFDRSLSRVLEHGNHIFYIM